MPQPIPPARRARPAAVTRSAASGPRTGELVARRQYKGLFLAPSWPPDDEAD